MTVSPVVFTLGFLSVLICTSELSLDFHGGGFLEGSVPRGLCGPSGRGLLCSYCSVTFRGAFLYVSFLIVCPLPHFFFLLLLLFLVKKFHFARFLTQLFPWAFLLPPGARCFLQELGASSCSGSVAPCVPPAPFGGSVLHCRP